MQALKNSLALPKSSINRFSYSDKKAKTYSSETLPQSDIAELFFSVWQGHQMTESNRQRLKFALLSYQELNESDYRLINRLLHAVKRGWIKITE